MRHGEASDSADDWDYVLQFYRQISLKQNLAFVAPMVSLVTWIREQPWSGGLYPSTSLVSLCLSLHPGGYQPFASFDVQVDGYFLCQLWAAIGKLHSQQKCPLSEAQEAICSAIRSLALLERRS